jgi:hypothetical protein
VAADTTEGGGDGGSGVTAATAAVDGTECCMRAAAAASSLEGSSAWPANAILIWSGRVRRKMALKRTSPFAGISARSWA